jgi:tRNA nucleotidyltransferase/poly(A) polymerase
LLSLLIIDKTDNSDYFIYKYNISKKDQKRIKIIDKFLQRKISLNTFLEKNINKFFYYNGKQAVLDILNFRIINSKRSDKKLDELYKIYENKNMPIMPIRANLLMTKYKIPEGKQLGKKLKIIEEEWVKNNFKISDQQVDNIVNN